MPANPVHPHTRGEHSGPVRVPGNPGGSSPHARGTPGTRAGGTCHRRFIPTRAGNTADSSRQRHAASVHPHTRGEHPAGVIAPRPGNGSSPHARGTHRIVAEELAHRRFIPTRAGNTAPSSMIRSEIMVHPHTRGEHALTSRLIPRISGSSPHARGTRTARCRRATSCAVHPHTRGEHRNGSRRAHARDGSSPHARGTPRRDPQVSRPGRFIPTRAGNTPVYLSSLATVSVHPHTRGEHDAQVAAAVLFDGSSPHARGTPAPADSPCARNRFIPTRAGNTRSRAP